MRAKKRIRASFSDNTIHIALPKGWRDLDQDELALAYSVIERYGDYEDIRLHFLRLAYGFRFVKRDMANGKYPVAVTAKDGDRPRTFMAYVSPEDAACWADELNWMLTAGDYPVRLDQIGEAKAVDAHFHGVDFRTYYMVENYYQGYIRSKNPAALQGAERLLYPGVEQEGEMPTSRLINILNWLIQIKAVFSAKFPNFFKPAGADAEPPDMLEVMNTQIRALTGGDVTKEEQINKIDCWRALTELDFKAKEAEEFRKIQRKAK